MPEESVVLPMPVFFIEGLAALKKKKPLLRMLNNSQKMYIVLYTTVKGQYSQCSNFIKKECRNVFLMLFIPLFFYATFCNNPNENCCCVTVLVLRSVYFILPVNWSSSIPVMLTVSIFPSRFITRSLLVSPSPVN